MNRRNFLAAALPAVLGTAALGARASTGGAAAPPRRIKIEVSELETNPEFGDIAANTIVVVADEGVETYAAFKRLNNLEGYDPQTRRAILVAQAVGPYLRVTPRVGADGRITVDADVKFEDPASGVAPSPTGALTLTENSVSGSRHTLGSGQSVMLDILPGVNPRFRLTATMLGPHQDA